MRKFFWGIFIIAALVSGSFYGISFADDDGVIKDGKKEVIESSVTKNKYHNISLDKAQSLVDFKLQKVNNLPEGFEELGISAFTPPDGAIKDNEELERKLTRVVMLYKHKNKNQFLEFIQTNHEMVLGNPAKDKKSNPLDIQKIKIGDLEISSHSCDCKDEKKKATTYFWYAGEKSYFLRAVNVKQETVIDVIKSIQ